MTATAITAPCAQYLALAEAVADRIKAALPILPLETPEQEQKAQILLRSLATVRAKGETLRKAEKAPYLLGGREVDARYNAPRDMLDALAEQLRRRVEQAKEARENERRAAIALAAEAARAGDAQAANAAIVVASTAAPMVAEGVGESWSFEPVSIDLAKVPREYLAIDMVRVNAVIRAAVKADTEPEIPGIVFKRCVSLRVSKL